MLLENDQFLSRLTLMFDKSRTKGHVRYGTFMKTSTVVEPSFQHLHEALWRSHKAGSETTTRARERKESQEMGELNMIRTKYWVVRNYLWKVAAIPPAAAPHPEPAEYQCLVRAVFRKQKISTVVHSKEVNKFQLAYCNLLKNSMDGLKRQKKQKTKKATQ